MLKTAGIPLWVTIFALIVLVVGCALGLMAVFGQVMEPSMSVSWGGRHLGLGLAAGVAVFLKSPTAYIAAFVGGVGRDVGDLIAHLGKSETSIGVVIGIVVFLIAGVLGIMAANKARKTLTSTARA
jgi:hypothetical protein